MGSIRPSFVRWEAARLERILTAYHDLVARAGAVDRDTESKNHLIRIARRTRRRLRRLGLLVHCRPDGRHEFSYKDMNTLPQTDEDKVIEGMATFIRANNLYFDSNGPGPSWGLALSTLRLTDNQVRALNTEGPRLVLEFANTAAAAIAEALHEVDKFVPRDILRGVPSEVIQLWKDATTERGVALPFVVRPDFVVGLDGSLIAVEFNVDGRLDRGICVGVDKYSHDIVHPGERIAAPGLLHSYRNECVRLTGSSRPFVAVIVSQDYRQAYRPQEQFFCRSLSVEGNLDCVLCTPADLDLVAGGRIVHRPSGSSVDVVIPELELVGADGAANLIDLACYRSILASATPVIGSCLPFADKALLALMPRNTWSDWLHLAPTTLIASQEDCGHLLQDREGYVLKRAGIQMETSGSKGVVIGHDSPQATWVERVNNAWADALAGRPLWLYQRLIKQRNSTITFRRRPRGLTRTADARLRISAFYSLRDNFASYELTGILATAGTDEMALKRGIYNIHAQRHSTYVCVTTSVAPAGSRGLDH